MTSTVATDELVSLLKRLGYEMETRGERRRRDSPILAAHPQGRKAVFVGDLVDRGPGVTGVLKLVMSMVAEGTALCVAGNHEAKLLRKLQGRNVQVTHGLAETLAQLDMESPEFREQAAAFLDGLISHYVLDGGDLVVAHAGMKAEYQGRASARVRDFCLYGETTGETDEFGLPVRANWAAGIPRAMPMIVYGHTPVAEPAWLNNTINVDTGCVFGGKLTALRYPEREVGVGPSGTCVHYEPIRPLTGPQPSLRQTAGDGGTDLLDIGDVIGKRIVSTGLRGNVTVREENAAAALEVMSRFAVDPRWLVYLPPTISPCETSGPARVAGTSGRGVRILPAQRRVRSSLRREAHGFEGHRRDRPGRSRH